MSCVKKLSQRVARLTPSITAGLIFFAVGLTALLAYRAFDASRTQQQLTEHTLRDYAGFAAFQLKNATIARMMGQNRLAVEPVVRWISTRGSEAIVMRLSRTGKRLDLFAIGATGATRLLAYDDICGGAGFYYG